MDRLDGRTDRQIDIQMDGWTDGQIRWKDGQMDGPTEQTDGTDRQNGLSGWTDK